MEVNKKDQTCGFDTCQEILQKLSDHLRDKHKLLRPNMSYYLKAKFQLLYNYPQEWCTIFPISPGVLRITLTTMKRTTGICYM